MGKAFHGPFRLVELTELERGRDGDFFVSFRDINGNVLGVIMDHRVLQEVGTRITIATAQEMCASAFGGDMSYVRATHSAE